jgi:serine/threonine protein kinase/Tol biopolymer transport system component
MNSAQYERVKELFEVCRTLAPAERAKQLAEVPNEGEVASEVCALLEAYDRSVDFLEKPVLEQQAAIVERVIRQTGQLPAGTKIGHYEIADSLGSGGMGVVYRARDTRLGRDVALKMLAPSVADDPVRRARFQSEARALAAMNHSNIASIFDVEEDALVMELVDGQTLAERLQAGPIPLDETIEIAKQIATGLEAAHERGITHRDLKPANIKRTPEGTVKLLDFGLAKTNSEIFSDGAGSAAPPLLPGMSAVGMILGTAGYMAPEQAAGKVVDKRADVWAFGVVLFEMLSGKNPFDEETATDPLDSDFRADMNGNTLPDSTTPQLRVLLRRCLERNPKKRLRDIGEARILLEDLASGGTPAETPVQPASTVSSHQRIWTRAAVLSTITALGLGLLLWRHTRPVYRPLIRLSVDLGEDAVLGANLTAAISPDGTRLVHAVRRGNGPPMLATRLLEESTAKVLEGSEGATDPFFSPDGQWIGFFSSTGMKKIFVSGGAPVTLCGVEGVWRGAAWGKDGFIIANLDNSHLVRVPENGGTPEMLSARPEDHGEQTWRWPQILPGGEYVLFTGSRGPGVGEGYEDANLEVLSLKTGKVTVLHRGGYFGRYLPSGHLTYVQRGTLFAMPFDLATLKTRGTPVPVLDDVGAMVDRAAGQLDFSSASGTPGIFLYLSGKRVDPVRTLVTMDTAGQMLPLLTTNGGITPKVSPDGKVLALSIYGNILLYDIERFITTALTTNRLSNNSPIWTRDGKHIIFTQGGGETSVIWWIGSDGSGKPQKLFESRAGLRAHSLSPDGRWLAYSRQNAITGWDIWTLPLDHTDPERPKPGNSELFLKEPRNQAYPMFSPDGKWMAYASEALGGSTEVFVRPFPADASAPPRQISTDTGWFPVWSNNGKDLFYLSTFNNHLMRVPYTVGSAGFVAGTPKIWSPVPLLLTATYWNFDLMPDGKHIITFPAPSRQESVRKNSVHVTLLLNFFDELKRRVP